MIEGLTAYTAPAGTVQKGRLSLPPEFNSNQFVGKWVKQGPSVAMAKQRVPIPSESVVADGWAVWEDKNKKPCIRTISSGAFILMFRPRVLQEAINKIHGNQSRKRMLDEAQGKTVTSLDGGLNGDRGMLTPDKLATIPGLRESEPTFEGDVRLNSVVESPEPVQAVVHQPEIEKTSPKLKKHWAAK